MTSTVQMGRGYLDKSEDRCQPCANFTMSDHNPRPHQCPTCGGTRRWCYACHADHHENGWNTCGVTEHMRGCSHPKCVEKVEQADLLASLKSLRAIIHDYMTHGEQACVADELAKADAVIAKAGGA